MGSLWAIFACVKIVSYRKKDSLIKILNNALVDIPAPVNISAWWNFGSLLGLCLITQIITGLFLSFHYSNSLEGAFDRVVHISRDVNFGWLFRTLHANTASVFFICLYLHTGRGLYYKSYLFPRTWTVGITILFLVMLQLF